MDDRNPYRSPLAHPETRSEAPEVCYSLAIGLLIDGVGALCGAIWLAQLPALRLFLPFAAAHAVAAALITYRTRRRGIELSAGDHFFLRYGAVIMAAATAAVRAWMK